MFLPDDMPYQDVWLKFPWSTLAYAQALLYWAEKANPPVPSEPCLLVMSVHELRWQMRRYTTFHDHSVFEGLACGLPAAEVKEAPKPNPHQAPTSRRPHSSHHHPSYFGEHVHHPEYWPGHVGGGFICPHYHPHYISGGAS